MGYEECSTQECSEARLRGVRVFTLTASGGAIDEHTIFGVSVNGSLAYRFNKESIVRIPGTGLSFRNPVGSLQLEGHSLFHASTLHDLPSRPLLRPSSTRRISPPLHSLHLFTSSALHSLHLFTLSTLVSIHLFTSLPLQSTVSPHLLHFFPFGSSDG